MVWTHAPHERDVLELQLVRQALQPPALASVSGDDQASIPVPVLNQREGAQHAGDVVVSLEIAVR